MGIRRFLRSLRETSPAAVQARVDAVHRSVAALSAEEAEAEVQDCVMMADPFRAEQPASDQLWSPAPLPPTVRSLFLTFGSISAGGMTLSRADVAPFSRKPEFIRIGSDLEHADVVVRPSDQHVFVIEDDGAPEADLSDEHQSVWHYLLEVAEHSRRQPSRPAV